MRCVPVGHNLLMEVALHGKYNSSKLLSSQMSLNSCSFWSISLEASSSFRFEELQWLFNCATN